MRVSKKNSNYMDKEKIIFLFNKSVSNYNAFCRLPADDQSFETLERLNTAGVGLFESFEAALKHTLVYHFKRKNIAHEISWPEFIAIKEKVEHMTRMDLINLLVKCDPERLCTTNTISYNIISSNAYSVTNGKKHMQINVLKEAYEETLPHVRNYIRAYLDDSVELEAVNADDPPPSAQAISLFEETNYFDTNGSWSYVLLIDSVAALSESQRRALVQLKWAMVLDMDNRSDESGLCKAFRNLHKLQPSRFSLECPERTVFNKYSCTPYWFFLNGLEGLPESLPNPEDRRSWNQKYGKVLNATFEHYHKTFEKCIKVVILSSDTTKVKKIAEELDTVYAEKVRFLLLSQNHPNFLDIYPETKTFSMGIYEFARSLLCNGSLFGTSIQDYKCMMPDKDGTMIPVVAERYNNFELVHQNIAEDSTKNEAERRPDLFYQGIESLSWYGAQQDFAVSRGEISKWLKKQISEREGSFDIIDLFHEPGIGGSTFARQFAYEMRKSQPMCILRQYTKELTATQLYNLYMELRALITVFIDASLLSPDQVISLKNEMKPMSFPFVLVYIRRTLEGKKTKINTLNGFEFEEMVKRLAPFADMKKMELLTQIKNTPYRTRERSPFFMSLYTFEENFAGVPPYIANFLKDMTDQQKELLVYIAIADLYANKPLNEAFFPAPLIMNDEESTGTDAIWGENTAFDSLIIPPSPGPTRVYRIRHYLFAEEIIKQIVYQDKDGNEVSDEEKASNLCQILISFIRFSKMNSTVEYDTTLEILCNLFIVRSGDDLNKERFSPLIRRVMELGRDTRDGTIRAGLIFKELTRVYSDNGHFKGHLSRFYSYVDGNYDEGVRLAAEAATESERYEGKIDPILYHIYGMSLKLRIVKDLKPDAIDSKGRGSVKEEDECVSKIVCDADNALFAFEKSRMANNQDAGYQAAISLCIDVLDLAKKLSGLYETEAFISKDSTAWYMRYLDEAENLMRSWQSEEEYVENNVQAQLNDFYGDRESLERTISMWQRALDKADPEQAPQCRRLLARAKQKRAGLLGYENVNAQDIDDIINLAEKNIRFEPKNSANIRIWFDALRYCTSNDPELLLDEAISKLSAWKYSSDTIEAYYYYFICICIKAIEGSSRATADIPGLQIELKTKAGKRVDNRRIYEWLGVGKGLRRLKRYSTAKMTPEDISSLAVLSGYVKSYKNDSNATILSNNMEVFFNPKRAKRAFTKDSEGLRVTFSSGFSYDGLRAYDYSVEEAHDDISEPAMEKLSGEIDWRSSPRVKCRVINHLEYYVQVKLVDYHEQVGSIHIQELGNDFSGGSRPDVGKVFYATVIGPQNKGYWQLSLKDQNAQDNVLEVPDALPDWKKKLINVKMQL